MILQRHRPSRHRHDHTRADPLYGFGYRPDWPSILSVAHDTTDGARVFIIMDRPCVLYGPALPFTVAGGGSIVDATTLLPVKFRVAFAGAIPQGASWAWGADATQLIDPVSGHGPNVASGFCADVPGPHTVPHVTIETVETLGDVGDAVRIIFSGPVQLADPMILPAGGFRTNGEGVPEDAVVQQVDDGIVHIQADSWAGTRVQGVPWQIIYPPEFLDGAFAICDNGAGEIVTE
jgi:hypothetical protein